MQTLRSPSLSYYCQYLSVQEVNFKIEACHLPKIDWSESRSPTNPSSSYLSLSLSKTGLGALIAVISCLTTGTCSSPWLTAVDVFVRCVTSFENPFIEGLVREWSCCGSNLPPEIQLRRGLKQGRQAAMRQHPGSITLHCMYTIPPQVPSVRGSALKNATHRRMPAIMPLT